MVESLQIHQAHKVDFARRNTASFSMDSTPCAPTPLTLTLLALDTRLTEPPEWDSLGADFFPHTSTLVNFTSAIPLFDGLLKAFSLARLHEALQLTVLSPERHLSFRFVPFTDEGPQLNTRFEAAPILSTCQRAMTPLEAQRDWPGLSLQTDTDLLGWLSKPDDLGIRFAHPDGVCLFAKTAALRWV